MSERPSVTTLVVDALDDAALDSLAERLAPRIAERLVHRAESWLSAKEAASYLGLGVDALHKLSPRDGSIQHSVEDLRVRAGG